MAIMSSIMVGEVPGLRYGLVVVVVTILSTLIYRVLLPKPIPGGLPFKKQSTKRLLGDAPDVRLNTAEDFCLCHVS